MVQVESSLAVFEVDHQLELRRLLDRNVGGLCSFENLVCETITAARV